MKIKFLLASLFVGASIYGNAQGFQDAIDFYSIGEYENAKVILDKNLSSASDKAEADYYQGMIALKTGKLAEAKKFFDAGVAADAKNALNYVGQGAVLLKQGDKGAAQAAFKLAQNINKKDAKVESAIAEAYFFGDKVAYAKDIEKCIQNAYKWTKNQSVAAALAEGNMAYANEQWGDAQGKYEMAMTLDPTNTEATVKYADTYFHVNKPLAISTLKEIIASRPNSALIQRHLAEMLFGNGEFKEAAERYERYISSTSNHFDKDEARYAQLLYFADKFPECYDLASSLKNKLTPASPYYIPSLRMMWYSKANMKEWKEAEEIGKEMFSYKKSDDDQNFNFKDLVMYANVCEQAGDAETAVKYYDDAIRLNPENIELARRLAKQSAEAKDYAKALHYAHKVLENEKKTPDDIAELASIYQKHATDSATSADVKATAIAEGLKAIDQVLADDPTNIMYLYHKANLQKATESKNTGAAKESMVKMISAIKALPADTQKAYDGTLVYAYSYLAVYYFGAKQNDKALEYFKAWAEVDPTNQQVANVIATLSK